MKQAGIEETPEFNKSLTNNPHIERVHGGGMFGSTVLTVLEVIRDKRTVADEDVLTFLHHQKKRCEVFCRCRIVGTDTWIAFPTTNELGQEFEDVIFIDINDIREDAIVVQFLHRPGEYEFEIFLVDLHV